MGEQRLYRQTSVVLRAMARVTASAETSVTARVLARLGTGLCALGSGTLAAGLMRFDWGAEGWLATSLLARGVTWFGQGLEKVVLAGAKRLQTAWSASWVGRGLGSLRKSSMNTMRFGAGLLLGFAIGTMVLGRLAGTLTELRLLTAVALVPMGGLMLVYSQQIQAWIDSSRFLDAACYLLSLGASRQE